MPACSSTHGGTPTPLQPDEPYTSTEQPSASSVPNTAPLADVDPCSLLSAQELGKYGMFPPGETDNVGSSRGCKFQKDRQSNEHTLVTSVGIRDQQGINDAVDS